MNRKKSYRVPDGAFHHKHSLGQNFIEDEALLDQLAGLSLVDSDDCVLEVGPGLGALTKPLAARAKQIVSIEIDHTLIPILRVTLEHSPNAEIVEGDVMKIDLAALVREKFGEKCSLRVAANLPYYITTDVLTRMLRELPQAKSFAVMIQKEVGDKLMSSPGEEGYGPLAIECQYACHVECALHVPAACFTPPPKVDSSFMVLTRHEAYPIRAKDDALFWKIVKCVFTMRRKTVVNNLMSGFAFSREAAIAVCQSAGIDEKARAEQLTIAELCALSDAVGEAKQ